MSFNHHWKRNLTFDHRWRGIFWHLISPLKRNGSIIHCSLALSSPVEKYPSKEACNMSKWAEISCCTRGNMHPNSFTVTSSAEKPVKIPALILRLQTGNFCLKDFSLSQAYTIWISRLWMEVLNLLIWRKISEIYAGIWISSKDSSGITKSLLQLRRKLLISSCTLKNLFSKKNLFTSR